MRSKRRMKQYGHLTYGREKDMPVLKGDALRSAAFPRGVDLPVTPQFSYDLRSQVQLMSFDGVSWYPMRVQMAEMRRLARSMRAEERADSRRLRLWSFRARLRSSVSSV